jgi:DNA-binding NarL/FixJ family response regulator
MARLVIVDDHPIVRDGLKAYLSLHHDLEIVGEAGSAAEALDRVDRALPDLVLLDVQLPDRSGLTLIEALRSSASAPRVVILTSFLDGGLLDEALRRGATGYLLKHQAPGVLVTQLRAALRGEVVLAGEAIALLAQPRRATLAALTPREREVLQSIARGMSNKQIARALGIAEKTVKTHVSRVLDKLGARDRTQAALIALGHGGDDEASRRRP